MKYIFNSYLYIQDITFEIFIAHPRVYPGLGGIILSPRRVKPPIHFSPFPKSAVRGFLPELVLCQIYPQILIHYILLCLIYIIV